MKQANPKLKIIFTAFLALGSLVFSKKTQAAEIQAASCAQSDVQAAINAAQAGDTVKVPEGECVWSLGITVSDNKKIVLKGTGMNRTKIKFETSGTAVSMGMSGSRLTGFEFNLGSTATGVNLYGTGWRIDHCCFNNLNTADYGKSAILPKGLSAFPGPVGLVDNCEFNDTRILAVGDASLLAHSLWAEPLGLGTEKAVYVEDCVFNRTVFGNAIDTNYGGSYVFRYNIVNDGYLEAHSLQGTHRATRKWEIYGNTINQKNRSVWVPMFLRGGTGVIFDNTITGTWGNPAIAVDNVRSFSSRGEGGQCDGTSLWDGNEDATGYPCRDQIGRSTDQWLWTTANPYPPQELDPVYAWNNKYQGSDITFFVHNCPDGLGSCQHIKENRDFYNDTVRPGYISYTYPHPLRNESDAIAPSFPVGLSVR